MEEPQFRGRIMSLQRLMYSVALRMGITSEEAADIVQNTLLRLWRNRNGIPDDEIRARAYCMAALRNECVSSMRRSRETEPIETAVSIKAPPPNETTESRDTRRYIERIIDTLPEGQQTVIRMSSFGQFSVAEISEATGQTPENVRQLLSRARKRLRQLMD